MNVGRLPNESPEYAKQRSELLKAEIALKDQVARVAALRRQLPLDTAVEDQTFAEIRDGERVPVRLSELFEDPAKPLVLLHFMYGNAQTHPCPMCTLWADGYDGVVPHLAQRANFAVFVAGDPGAFAEYAGSRGWRNLRIVSAADSDLKRQLGFETPDGNQLPGLSVFQRRGDEIVHFTSTCAMLGEGHWNGMDLLSPLWHFLDFLPAGRTDFMPQKRYED